jgi:hypothetical protein
MSEPTDTTTPGSCLHCIDGMALSRSELLGVCFRVCPACQPTCPCCNGRGCYPAWTTDMTALIAAYNDAGLAPMLCHTCGGVVGVARLDQETP